MKQISGNSKGFIVFLLLIAGNASYSTDLPGKDEPRAISVTTERVMLERTPWSGSANAASLSFFDFSSGFGTASLNYAASHNDYHRFQDPESSGRYGFFTSGYVRQGKWKFFGIFNYFNEKAKKVKWVDVMEPYAGNPYTVGDSVGGDYSREYFIMEGKSALPLSKTMTFGFDVRYKAGVGAKRKDPRPENTLTDFEFSPGIIFTSGRFKLGGNVDLGTAKEDIDFTIVTDKKFDLFYFRGLGVFSSTLETDSWYTSKKRTGGGIQVNYRTGQLDNLNSVHFSNTLTDIKRGDSYPLQVVSLEDYSTEISSVWLLFPQTRQSNRIGLFCRLSRLYGDEPVVEPKLEEISWQWSTAAKYTLYWHSESRFGFSLSHTELSDSRDVNWAASLSGEISGEKTTYYYVPEYNQETINLVNFRASLVKGYRIRENQLVINLEATFRNSFNNRLEIVDDQDLLKYTKVDFLKSDFDYRVSRLWGTSVTLTGGRQLSVYKSTVQLFYEAKLHYGRSGLPGNPGETGYHFSIGMNF